ncbi:hypothetical protein [Vibrio splendidus]|uniref:hypothetical protein n=1 Tax=Vibrio splendidus TaxID=29497 RepID=UPI000D333514|nr:hypothetical protein [Vibrio splendidus]PTO69377.1 hypothetical protein CWN81_17765 [Vibrio splendidus]
MNKSSQKLKSIDNQDQPEGSKTKDGVHPDQISKLIEPQETQNLGKAKKKPEQCEHEEKSEQCEHEEKPEQCKHEEKPEQCKHEDTTDSNESESSPKRVKFKKRIIKIPPLSDLANKSQDELKAAIRKQLEQQLETDNLDDELVENVLEDVERKLSKKRVADKKSLFGQMLSTAVLMVVTSFFIAMALTVLETKNKYVGKNDIREPIVNAINKGTQLEDIKIIYSKKSQPINIAFWALFKGHLYYETSSLTLQVVLEDLKVAKLTQSDSLSVDDKKFIGKLEGLLETYHKVNPFDGLDDQDIRDFKNISQSIGENEYHSIEDEIQSLASSMKTKNDLINQYLNSSNLSLYLSIFAITLTCIIFLYQTFVSRKSSQKQMIAEVINSLVNVTPKSNS